VPFLTQFVRPLRRGNSRSVSVLAVGILFAWNIGVAVDKPAPPRDWEVVRSVPDEFGGTMHFVLVSEATKRDREHYRRIGDALCKSRTQCSVYFWTDHTHVPQSAWMSVSDLAVMTASYESHPTYPEPHISLACWLYPSKAIGESVQCMYLPSAKVPPAK
jgi:hypothetical protein